MIKRACCCLLAVCLLCVSSVGYAASTYMISEADMMELLTNCEMLKTECLKLEQELNASKMDSVGLRERLNEASCEIGRLQTLLKESKEEAKRAKELLEESKESYLKLQGIMIGLQSELIKVKIDLTQLQKLLTETEKSYDAYVKTVRKKIESLQWQRNLLCISFVLALCRR